MERTASPPVRLSLGPLQYFWPRQRLQDFYREAAGWPVDVVYLGETVFSKRREFRLRDWLALADELARCGREVVLSTLSLLEAESEVGSLQRLVDNGRFQVEANDWSAVHLCRQRGLPTEGIRIIQRMVNDPSSGMVGKVELEIQVPPSFPEKYLPAMIRSAELCAVKKHLETPPKCDIFTRTVELSNN